MAETTNSFMTIRFFSLFYLLIVHLHIYSQSDVRLVSAASLPKEINEIAGINLCIRWTDSTGDNVVVSRGGTLPLVYHFLIKNDSADWTWKIAGSRMSCEVADRGDNVKSSFIVTDLDKNHIAEIWIIFKAICVNDETPSPMKIVMYVKGQRYLLTGTTLAKDGNTILGGTYRFDEAFQRAPKVYKEYADQLWKQNASD